MPPTRERFPLDLTEMYRRLQPLVYQRVRRQVKDSDEAKDITQEAFIVLLRHLRRLGNNESQALPLLNRIATCKVIDHCRRKKRWSNRLAWGFAADEEQEAAGERETHRVEAARELALLTRGASPKALEAALLRLVEERSLADAGLHLGVSPRTVERLVKNFVGRVHKRSARLT